MKGSKKDIFKYILLSVFVASFSNLVHADFDNSDPEISSVFVRGAILVYDCNQQNLVCANERSFKYCSGFNPKNKPCKLIKKFNDEPSCHKLQLKLSSDNFTAQFCKEY